MQVTSYSLSLSLTCRPYFLTKVRPKHFYRGRLEEQEPKIKLFAVAGENNSRKSNCWQTIARTSVENAIYHGFFEQQLPKTQFTASASPFFSCFFNPMPFFIHLSPVFCIYEVRKHHLSSPKHFYRGRFNFQEPFFQSTTVVAFFIIFHIFPMVGNSCLNFSLAGADIHPCP